MSAGFGTSELCEEHPDLPGFCAYHRTAHQRTLDAIAADPRCPSHGYAHGYDCVPLAEDLAALTEPE